MIIMLIGFGVTLSALAVQGIAVAVGVETIGVLMAKRVVGMHVWRKWRLLGPQTAASGTLAFGWSTAAIVAVVIRLVRYRHRTQVRDESRGRSRETREPQSAHQ